MVGIPGRRLTWSNGLTGLRLVTAPLFFCAILEHETLLSFILFWFAVLTDLTDGRVARARGETSPFGGVFDHATDATFVSLGLFALSQQGIIPLALPVVVVVAFFQYLLDSKSLSGQTLRTSFLGRWNGILYFVPLGVVVTRDCLGIMRPTDQWVRGLGLALLLSTLISMADRGWALYRSQRDSNRG